jgi:hypothetical protein
MPPVLVAHWLQFLSARQALKGAQHLSVRQPFTAGLAVR